MSRSSYGRGPCRICGKMLTSAGFAQHAHDRAHLALGHVRIAGYSRYHVEQFVLTNPGRALRDRQTAVSMSGEAVYWYVTPAEVVVAHAVRRDDENPKRVNHVDKRNWRVERRRLGSHFAYVIINEGYGISEVLWDVPRGEKEPKSRQVQRMLHAAISYIHAWLPAELQHQPALTLEA